MEKQVDVTLLPVTEEHCRRVRWLICDNGMTVAHATAVDEPATSACVWEQERPPAEYEGQVRLAIARARAAR